MAEGNSAGERSEDATPKRLKEARDKGQVARSKELTTALLLMTASISLYSFSGNFATGFANMAKRAIILRLVLQGNVVLLQENHWKPTDAAIWVGPIWRPSGPRLLPP